MIPNINAVSAGSPIPTYIPISAISLLYLPEIYTVFAKIYVYFTHIKRKKQ